MVAVPPGLDCLLSLLDWSGAGSVAWSVVSTSLSEPSLPWFTWCEVCGLAGSIGSTSLSEVFGPLSVFRTWLLLRSLTHWSWMSWGFPELTEEPLLLTDSASESVSDVGA